MLANYDIKTRKCAPLDSQEALMTATRKRQDPAALDSISVAFVTFEHEESKRRCLEDYRYSRRGFCRYVCMSMYAVSGRGIRRSDSSSLIVRSH